MRTDIGTHLHNPPDSWTIDAKDTIASRKGQGHIPSEILTELRRIFHSHYLDAYPASQQPIADASVVRPAGQTDDAVTSWGIRPGSRFGTCTTKDIW